MEFYSSAQGKYLAVVGQTRAASRSRAVALAEQPRTDSQAVEALLRYAALRLGVSEALVGWYEVAAARSERGFPALARELRDAAEVEAELRELLTADLIELFAAVGVREGVATLDVLRAVQVRRFAELRRRPPAIAEPWSAVIIELELRELVRAFERALLDAVRSPAAKLDGRRYLRRSLTDADGRIATYRARLGAIAQRFPERLGEWTKQADMLTQAFASAVEVSLRADEHRGRASPAHSPPAEPPFTELR